MNEVEKFKGFLEKIALLPMNLSASKPRPASASTTITAPPPAPKAFNVTLKPMRGEAKSLKLAVETGVGELRLKAAQMFAVDEPELCRLIRNGRALQDDGVSLSTAFGLGSAEVTLHLLEKPKEGKITLSEAVWKKIEQVLEGEAGLSEASQRKSIIDKFRSTL